MKKFLIILFIFLLSSFNLSFADEIEDIEKERQHCLSSDIASNIKMAQCNYIAMDKFDEITKEYMNKLKSILSKEDYAKLKQSQHHWKKYNEEKNILLKKTIESKQGLFYYLLSSGEKYNNKKNRAEELISLYKALTIDEIWDKT